MPQQPRSRTTHPGWEIGRVSGVPVFVARSWLLIAAAVMALYGPRLAGGGLDLGLLGYAVAAAYAVALFLSVLVHELAHALVAQRVGLPATHIVINLWGGHTQFETEAPTPGRSFAVAVVGPLSNGALAVLAYLAWVTLDPFGVSARLLLAVAVTNGFVALFNVVPGLPLDGGRMLEAVVWRITGDRGAGTVVAGWAGRVLAVTVVLIALAPFALGRPPSILLVIWAVLVGPMLWSGAGQAIASAGVRRRAQGLRVDRLMHPAGVVPLAATVQDVLGILSHSTLSHSTPDHSTPDHSTPDHSTPDHSPAQGVIWVVTPDGRVVGVLDPRAAASVAPERRPFVAVGSVAAAHDPRSVVGLELSGDDLVTTLRGLPGDVYAVLDRGRVVGSLHATDVVAALSGTPT